MGKKLFLILSALFLILVIGFIFFRASDKSQETPLAKSEEILNNLTLEKKIGQLFIIGFEGKVFNSEIEDLIKETHPGGILLLKRNIGNKEQLKELIDSLQKISLEESGLPLFIAVDQEGGLISRIEWIEKTPQSEIGTNDEAYRIGLKRGEGLKELGINLNLAPLLDTTEAGDFIFERSFQKNPKLTGELAGYLVRGQKESGVLTAIKHFPGYGGISFNPEEKLAVLENLPEILQFREANKSDSEMIMVSNVIYGDLDKDLPFSFSSKGIHFLKEKVSGDYLVLSDDLDQNSLLDKFFLEEIVSRPINAGVDILIFSGWRLSADQGVSALIRAVENNEVSEERINQSVLKIIKLKQKLYNEQTWIKRPGWWRSIWVTAIRGLPTL